MDDSGHTEGVLRDSSEFLSALSEQSRTPEKVSKIAIFRHHWSDIETSRAEGDSYTVIAKTLTQLYGEEFEVRTIRRYFSLVRKETASGQQPKTHPGLPQDLNSPPSSLAVLDRFTKPEELL